MTRIITGALAGGAALAVVACGSATASTGSSSSASSPSPGARGFRGAAGQLVQINGSSLILSGANGDTTVAYSASTVITETRTGTVASITPGECIVATGTKQASGIAVYSVNLSQPMNGSCTRGFGFGGGGGARPSPRPNFTPPPQFANRASVRGLVSTVSGTTVTVQPQTGAAQTITVPTTVTVTTTQVVTASALQTGQCVAAAGARSSSGDVTARSLTIVPAGPSGCFTGRGGFGFGGGGFPGGGGFGGGFGGGGSGGGGVTSTT